MPLTISEIDIPLPPMFAKDCELTRRPGRSGPGATAGIFQVSEAARDSARGARGKVGPPARARQDKGKTGPGTTRHFAPVNSLSRLGCLSQPLRSRVQIIG